MGFFDSKRNTYLIAAVVITIAVLLKQAGYLYFHAFVELSTILLSVFMFYKVLTNLQYRQNAFFVIISAGFISVGAVDALHALAYKGMGVFNVDELNTATQFWVVGRVMLALTFLAAVLFSGFSVRIMSAVLVSCTLAAFLTLLIFKGRFPDAFVEGRGLTQFKIYSEYAVIGILLLSMVNIYRLRENFSFSDQMSLSAAIGVAIVSEYCFTLYNDVYGISNFIGHILKMLSYMLVSSMFVKSFQKMFFRVGYE